MRASTARLPSTRKTISSPSLIPRASRTALGTVTLAWQCGEVLVPIHATAPPPGASARVTGATAGGRVRRWKNSHRSDPIRNSRDRRTRSQSHEPEAAGVSSSVNLWDHATSGLQTTWSTNTIMPSIARTPSSCARRSPCSMARLIYEPRPGSRKSCSPSTNASLTIKKNQPPAMDIMLFQRSPVAAKERSSRKNRSHHDIRARRATATKSGGTDFNDE